ncbi:MAG: type II secretion system protein [Sutterella wadsworthensis]
MNNSKRGFTLIEIVMVLVLLGILAAVAIPKYYDLKTKAEEQTAKTVAAEFQARLNGKFADLILDGKTCEAAVTGALTEAQTVGRDTEQKTHGFTIEFNPAENTANATLTVKKDNETRATVTIAVPKCGKITN